MFTSVWQSSNDLSPIIHSRNVNIRNEEKGFVMILAKQTDRIIYLAEMGIK